jgi:hypothetical protein
MFDPDGSDRIFFCRACTFLRQPLQRKREFSAD